MTTDETLSDRDYLIAQLGITHDTNQAGFILPDGQLLHLQRKEVQKRMNHLDVIKLLPQFHEQTEPISDTQMIEVMAAQQLVRFCINGTIHSAVKPSSPQIRKIYSILAYRSSPFEIILSNPAGMTLSQHRVSGPSMATLVKIFKQYEQEEISFSGDEFFIEESDNHFKLMFRPTMQAVGSINKKTQYLKMDEGFQQATKLFYQLIKQK